MKRLLSLDDLDLLIDLVEEHTPDERYDGLLEYLKLSRHNKYGDGSLYAANWKGMICLQRHKAEF